MHQLWRVHCGGQHEFVLVGWSLFPSAVDGLPIGAHGRGGWAEEAGIELFQHGFDVHIGIPVETTSQVQVEESRGHSAPALGIDSEDASGAVVLDVLADGLDGGVGDVAPDQHALVVVVDDEAALHGLGPAVHDIAVLLAGWTSGIVHAVDGAYVDGGQVRYQRLGSHRVALGRQGNIGIGQKANAAVGETDLG